MNIYLDIDNTLITSNGYETTPANHLKEFLDYMLKNHSVYWLSTHCNGDADTAASYISRFINGDFGDQVLQIKPTKWKVLKTEAINLNEDFIWFDDILTYGEQKVLEKYNKLGSFVKVDFKDNPDIFLDFIEKPVACRGYIIDFLGRSYMLHIWFWPKLQIGWHKKESEPTMNLFAIRRY